MNTSGRGLLWVLLGILLAGPVWADHGRGYRHRGGVHFGVMINPWMAPSPFYYPYSPTYYPAPIIVQSAPIVQQAPVYIEQEASAAPIAAPNYWYYCRAAKAYYPYVKECRGGWERVAPQPPQ